MIPAVPIALLAVALAAAAPAPPRSGPIAIRVDFEAPPGCSDVEAFYAAVLSRIDRARRAGPGEDGVRLQVRLSRGRNRVEGELRVVDGRGGGDRRAVSGLSCEEVVEGLSLTAALALDPGRAEPPAARAAARPVAPPGSRPSVPAPADTAVATPPPGSPTTPPPSPPTVPAATAPSAPERAAEPAVPPPPAPELPRPPPAPPATPEPPVVSAPASPPAPAGAYGLSVGLNAQGAALVSPYFSTGGAVSLRASAPRTDAVPASLALSLLYLPHRWLLPDEELVLDFTGAALTACPGWGIGGSITLEPCVRALGGWLKATNDAVTNPRTVGRTWWGVGAVARAAVRLGAGFSLEAELGFAVPLVERRFVTTTPERQVGETPTISTMVGLGLVRGL